VDDKNNIFYNEEHKNDSIWKKIARFFASFFGLFLILAAYTLLGEIMSIKDFWKENYSGLVIGSSQFQGSRSIAPTFYVQLLSAQIPKGAKRNWWLHWIFTLLGSALIKAEEKHVGEIDLKKCLTEGSHKFIVNVVKSDPNITF